LNKNYIKFKIISKFSNYKNIYKTIKLGLYLVLTNILSNFVFFVIRLLITKEYSLVEVGYFQAAWTLAMFYTGIILNSMAIDYYPRLSSVIKDSEKINSEINLQMKFSLYVGIPLISLFLLLVDYILLVLYSDQFIPAANLTSLFILTNAIKFYIYPLSYIPLAYGDGKFFFLLEFIANIVLLIITYFFVQLFGFIGIGYSYLLFYLYYMVSVFIFVRKKYNISINTNNTKVFSLFTLLLFIQYLINFFNFEYRITMTIKFVIFIVIFTISIRNTLNYIYFLKSILIKKRENKIE